MASPAGRRVMGLLVMVLGGVAAVIMLLEALVVAYTYGQVPGMGGLPSQPAAQVPLNQVALTVALFVTALLIIRYGWRMRRDARVSDEPGDHSIS